MRFFLPAPLLRFPILRLLLLGLKLCGVGLGVATAGAAQQPTALLVDPPRFAALPGTLPDSTLLNQAPAFPGGEAALTSFIRERLNYPALAARNRIEGKVVVSFWLDERGRPYGFGVLKGLGAGLDEEAIRVLKEMPDWQPAIVNGQPTVLQLRIPVVFRSDR